MQLPEEGRTLDITQLGSAQSTLHLHGGSGNEIASFPVMVLGTRLVKPKLICMCTLNYREDANKADIDRLGHTLAKLLPEDFSTTLASDEVKFGDC